MGPGSILEIPQSGGASAPQGPRQLVRMVRLGLGRFGVEFWVELRAWDFPTEKVLPRTPFNY